MMWRCILGAVMLASVLSPATGQVQAARAHAVLYTWRMPASGTKGGWTFKGGVASYDGSGAALLLVPYTLDVGANFAIQAKFRMGGPGGAQYLLSGYGLTVRGQGAPAEAGSFFSDYEDEDNGPNIYWNGATVGGNAFTPDKNWHTYLLTVSGGWYILSIDGKEMVTFPMTGPLLPSRVGLFSTLYKVSVRDVQILSVPTPTGQAEALPSTRPYNLTLADLPSDTYFDKLMQHYYTNEETARERGVPLSSLLSVGRVSSYGVDYFSWAWRGRAYSSVSAFTSPTGALADAQQRYTILSKRYASNPNFTVLPRDTMGDHSFGISYDDTVGSYTLSRALFWVVQGSYSNYVTVSAIKDTAPPGGSGAEAMRLAQIVAAHLKQV